VADTIHDFFFRSQYRYDASKGRLRSYLRKMTNARVVDRLRKERPIDHLGLDDSVHALLPDESHDESEAFRSSLLRSLINDVRAYCSPKQFEVFERVKLKYQSPADVAEELRITRAAVDRHVHDVRTKLSKLALQKDYKEEYYG
jgi:RNA polymerase sigma factor (sigma-70 family)